MTLAKSSYIIEIWLHNLYTSIRTSTNIIKFSCFICLSLFPFSRQLLVLCFIYICFTNQHHIIITIIILIKCQYFSSFPISFSGIFYLIKLETETGKNNNDIVILKFLCRFFHYPFESFCFVSDILCPLCNLMNNLLLKLITKLSIGGSN